METTKRVVKAPLTDDCYTHIVHKSGLNILICEMPEYDTTKAMFGTRYGSINTCFKTAEESDYCHVPEGIAHFLEHKLFENEDCDAFARFAKTGASANAFTTFDKTCYYFTCSDHFYDSLEILLDFVQTPYFTKENVAKEQGIIGQEIKMCNDEPGWRIFFNMLRGLYKEHPVKIDIAGTVDSIAEITDDLLYRCYHTFYNLHNMVLSIAGNCEVDKVLEVCDRVLKDCKDVDLSCQFPQETKEIVRKETVEEASVGIPMFNLGFKCNTKDGYENLKVEMVADLALSVLCGSSSEFYQTMLEQDLINSTFGTEVFNGDGFFSIIFEGESVDCYKVKDCIMAEIQRVKQEGLDEARFEEYKKMNYGSLIRELGSVNQVCSTMLNAYMGDVEIYDQLRVLSEMTVEDCNAFICEELSEENCTLSILKPITQEA